MTRFGVFSGEAVMLCAVPVVALGRAIFDPVQPELGQVRHLLGYELFWQMYRSWGDDTSQNIRTSLTAFVDAVREHGDYLSVNSMRESAEVFLGNLIIQLRSDARWIRYGQNPPSAGNAALDFELPELLSLLIEADEQTVRTCVEMIEEWARS